MVHHRLTADRSRREPEEGLVSLEGSPAFGGTFHSRRLRGVEGSREEPVYTGLLRDARANKTLRSRSFGSGEHGELLSEI